MQKITTNPDLAARLMRLDRIVESLGCVLGCSDHPVLALVREEIATLSENAGHVESRLRDLEYASAQLRREEFFADVEASRCP